MYALTIIEFPMRVMQISNCAGFHYDKIWSYKNSFLLEKIWTFVGFCLTKHHIASSKLIINQAFLIAFGLFMCNPVQPAKKSSIKACLSLLSDVSTVTISERMYFVKTQTKLYTKKLVGAVKINNKYCDISETSLERGTPNRTFAVYQ